MVKELTHFIGGKHVKGTSGRFLDVTNPNTGEVTARTPLATAAELRAAVGVAAKAFPGWAATNPQRRARVMFEFKRLLEANMDELAALLSAEHGKVLADARGDVQRGLEVIEFACGIPHLQKGEFTEGAGPGIDMYSMRQPLGVVAGITPFNFPAHDPDVDVRRRHRLRQYLHPQAVGEGSVGADASRRAVHRSGRARGRAQRRQRRQGGGRRDPHRSDHPGGELRRFVRHRAIHLCDGRRARQARAGDGRREEPRDHHARRRHGSGRQRSHRRGLRLGGRALHGASRSPCRSARRRRIVSSKSSSRACRRSRSAPRPIPKAITARWSAAPISTR